MKNANCAETKTDDANMNSVSMYILQPYLDGLSFAINLPAMCNVLCEKCQPENAQKPLRARSRNVI